MADDEVKGTPAASDGDGKDRRVLAEPGELLVRRPAPSLDVGVDEVDLCGRCHRLPRVLRKTIDTTIRPALARTTPRRPPTGHPQGRRQPRAES